MSMCVCVHVCVSREEPLPVAGFSFCVCFLQAYIYMYVYACTQDVSSSAHVDTGPGSNLCVFFPVLSPTRPECSFIHLFLHSKKICTGLTWCLCSQLRARGLLLTWSSQRAHSLQDEADFTRRCEPMGKIHSAREGEVGRRAEAGWGATSHGAKQALLRDACLSSLCR